MSPALSGSSAIRRFEGNDAIEIRDGITFKFYTGLPHVHSTALSWASTHPLCREKFACCKHQKLWKLGNKATGWSAF